MTFLLLALLLVQTPLAAQEEAVFNYPLTETTKPAFLAVCRALSPRPVIRGTFEQTKTITRLNRSLVSQGNFTIAGDFGMIWETLKPYPSTMAVGRDFIVQETSPGNRTRLNAQGNETFLRLADTISAIFTGSAPRLLDNFDVSYAQTAERWTVGLIPRKQAIRSFAARIILSGERSTPGRTAVIQSIVLFEQNGDAIQYSLSNHRFPQELTAGEQALFQIQ